MSSDKEVDFSQLRAHILKLARAGNIGDREAYEGIASDFKRAEPLGHPEFYSEFDKTGRVMQRLEAGARSRIEEGYTLFVANRVEPRVKGKV